ncbi:hypothetical protein F2P56_036976 [Juglans regia]|uniref:ABC1 atypical kinase-like domain-containing protein n=1 Tax=Juglans regia TaxID=51240 RepID=A0A833TH35_JUGRE|nr:hypothetical protein F2P56_036976 [Juglans regia]
MEAVEQLSKCKFYQKYTSNGHSFSPINSIAQAVSLSLARSHLLVPVTTLLISVVEGVVLFVRALYLAILFSPTFTMAPLVDCLGPRFRKLWLQVLHRTLEIAGPAFIKWGQWAATRPDLFPRDLCTKLSELHSKAPEHSFACTKKTIERAFGRELSELFENFEQSPVASRSYIAQVHRASLRFQYPGQQVKSLVVAVKVRHISWCYRASLRFQYPGQQTYILVLVAKVSKFIPRLKWWRLEDSVQQFAVFIIN